MPTTKLSPVILCASGILSLILFLATMGSAVAAVVKAVPTQITNSASNPVPVSGKVETTSADKTVLLLEEFPVVTSTEPANARTQSLDVSAYRAVRVMVSLSSCSGCGSATILVENPYILEKAVVPASLSDGHFQQVYEVPGETLTVAIGNNVGGQTSQWVVRVYGRRN